VLVASGAIPITCHDMLVASRAVPVAGDSVLDSRALPVSGDAVFVVSEAVANFVKLLMTLSFYIHISIYSIYILTLKN
jgi:hypothetical protein